MTTSKALQASRALVRSRLNLDGFRLVAIGETEVDLLCELCKPALASSKFGSI